MFDVVTSGFPTQSPYPAAGATSGEALDTNSGATWNHTPGQGWQPDSNAFAKAVVLGTTAAQAALLVITAPVTGLYQITTYAAQATSTNGTLPNTSASYTEGDTGVAVSAAAVATGAATTGQGQSQAVTLTINAKAGTTITVASAAPTTLTANVKARIAYLG